MPVSVLEYQPFHLPQSENLAFLSLDMPSVHWPYSLCNDRERLYSPVDIYLHFPICLSLFYLFFLFIVDIILPPIANGSANFQLHVLVFCKKFVQLLILSNWISFHHPPHLYRFTKNQELHPCNLTKEPSGIMFRC